MKRVILLLLLMGVFLSGMTIAAGATENAGFDAVYYASKYPDVAAAFGTDPVMLCQHYLTFGKNEGRFMNQAEELLAGRTKQSVSLPKPTPAADIAALAALAAQNAVPTPTPFPVLPIPAYIDVNITAQAVTYFENGIPVLQSPCVTGTVSAGRNTPQGFFSIQSKGRNVRLKGPTWDNQVDYWMPFIGSSIGLHDSKWRRNSEYGGQTYIRSGSHGCVNLPHDFAALLYEKVTVGLPVVVHE